jgi:polysaccharide export outer membrane protein
MKHTYIAWGLAAAFLSVAPSLASAQRTMPLSPAASPARSAGTEADKKALPAPPLVDSEYRLGPGDKLRIEVYKDQQLSQSVQIRPDGKITLPLIGDMEATHRTPIELRDTIATALKEYVTNPVVTVIVVEAVASQVFVMGEVAKAGPIPLNGPTTILQALAMAGGFREFANTKDVRVLRQTPGGLQTLTFNYKDAVNGDVKPFFLRSGDTVIVR